MDGSELVILCELAEKGALSAVVVVSTGGLARALGVSQQSASRRLARLEAKGLITKTPTPEGTQVRITAIGARRLDSFASRVAAARQAVATRYVVGKVQVGLGEGRYYMSQAGYRSQFQEKFGILPYPGTLNVLCNYAEKTAFLEGLRAVRFGGFKSESRTFGAVDVIPVKVDGAGDCFIIIPERGLKETAVLEVAAPFSLREKMSLKDGSRVKVEG